MDTLLTPVEARVLGCLVEKQATTPATYPLSRNALTAACNQKTSRDPVMNLTEAAVQQAVDSLITKTLALRRGGAGARVAKFAHCLHDRLNREYDFSRGELAIMAVLFLRGAQTRGELRSRSARIYEFESMVEVDDVLAGLQSRGDGPYVTELPVSPGQKESRFAHLACGDIDVAAQASAEPRRSTSADLAERVTALEKQVAELQNALAALRDGR
ncbi:MAG: DUF480 domain-containing protein [Gammaproteobacteria bacterium]|nr:DUF480 domain-containing protein [Gammaproteobacteria bacterium]NND60628.1 DUF480 domain-containing protein [Gammaproteobacteria bacterium]